MTSVHACLLRQLSSCLCKNLAEPGCICGCQQACSLLSTQHGAGADCDTCVLCWQGQSAARTDRGRTADRCLSRHTSHVWGARKNDRKQIGQQKLCRLQERDDCTLYSNDRDPGDAHITCHPQPEQEIPEGYSVLHRNASSVTLGMYLEGRRDVMLLKLGVGGHEGQVQLCCSYNDLGLACSSVKYGLSCLSNSYPFEDERTLSTTILFVQILQLAAIESRSQISVVVYTANCKVQWESCACFVCEPRQI